MVRAWLVVLVFLVGCPGKQAVHHPGEQWLGQIRVDGNKAIDDDDLIPGLALDRARRDGQAADPYQLSVDAQRIKNAYLKLGYFDVKVDFKIDRNDEEEIAVFTVVEGPRVKSLISIRGLPLEVPPAKARALIALHDNDPFDYEAYDDAKDPLKLLVADAGYAHVELYAAVTVDKARGIAVASYDIEPGARAKFGDITIKGVDQSPDLKSAIEGRLTFAKGDLYTVHAQQATLRALYELGRFSSVRIDLDDKQGAVVPATVVVTLAERHEVKGGGGVGYEPLTYEARLRGGASYIPADYPLWTMFADGTFALTLSKDGKDVEPKVRILGTAQRFDWLRPRLTAEIGAGFDFLVVEAYTSAGPVLRLGANTPFPGVPWLTVAANWSFSYLTFLSVGNFTPAEKRDLGLLRNLNPNSTVDERLGKFEQNIVADLRNDPFEPHRGGYIGLRVSEGTKFAGGAYEYLELQPDIRGYVPLGPMVLAARVRGGTILGDVPITERFFSGGAQSQRGFSERKLAPSKPTFKPDPVTGDPIFAESVLIGGKRFLETGVELRIPLPKDFGTTLFLDGADVPDDGFELDPFNLHWAAGAGISYKVGGFKLRVDVGYRLNRKGSNEPQVETGTLANASLHIGVGETY